METFNVKDLTFLTFLIVEKNCIASAFLFPYFLFSLLKKIK